MPPLSAILQCQFEQGIANLELRLHEQKSIFLLGSIQIRFLTEEQGQAILVVPIQLTIDDLVSFASAARSNHRDLNGDARLLDAGGTELLTLRYSSPLRGHIVVEGEVFLFSARGDIAMRAKYEGLATDQTYISAFLLAIEGFIDTL